MKKSFFKRAVATAAAVPLALTQCLTSSFAETSVDTAAQADISAAEGGNTITLEKLLRIEANKKYSDWNVDLDNALMAITLAGNTSGTIDTSKLVSLLSNSARSYKELAENVLGQVKNVQYTIDGSRNITITADVDNISEALSKDFDKSLGRAVKELAAGMGVDGGIDIDFTTVDASGKIEIVVSTSQLGAGTTVPVSFTFTPAGGSALDMEGSIQYAKDVIEQYRQIAYDKIDEYAADIDTDDAKAQIDKSFELYLGKVNAAADYYNRIATKTLAEKTYADVSGLIADFNANLKKNNINRQIPASGAAIAANATASAAYDVVLDVLSNAAGSVASFDIQLSEIGAFADSLKDVTFAAENGTYTITGTFDDAEADEVAAYYNSTPTEGDYVNSYKIFTGVVAIGSNDSVDVQIERVVETKPKTTTTTTTTTSSSTTTTTSSSTTTTSSSTTTTSSTTTSSSTTTTTTTFVAKELAKTYAEVNSEYGFYYSYEDSFNEGQISDAKLVKTYDNVAVDAEGNYILNEDGEKIVLSSETEEEDITGNVDFGTKTPENTYDVENTTFRYDIPLSYDGEALVDVNGEPITAEVYIGVRGDVTLDNVLDGSDATYMLLAYTNINSSTGQVDPDTVLFTREEMVTGPSDVLDHFAAFLGDADCDITDNWKAVKNKRSIVGADATYVLFAYTKLNSSYEGTEKELWEIVLE